MKKKLGMILLTLALLVNMLAFTGMSTAYAGGLSVKLSPAKVSLKSVRDAAETITAQVNGGTAPYTYQWQKSTDPTGTKKDISGAQSATYKPANAAGSAFYSVVVTDSTGQTATSDAIHVRAEATVPLKTELTVTKNWYSATVKLSSPLKLGSSWRAVAVTSATTPAAVNDSKGSSAITRSNGKYTGTIKLTNLAPDTTYYIYTCTYANGYNASGKTKETTVSKWSEPIKIRTTKVPAPKSLKVTAGTRKMTVKWKAMTNTRIRGYQISYKLKGQTAKKVKVTKRSAVSKVIKSLKKGKRYYVRIRAYAVISGKTYYGKWSTTVRSAAIK